MRKDQVYIDSATRRRLYLVTRIAAPTPHPETQTLQHMTVDELADTLLREAIESKYPAVLELERDLTKREREWTAANKESIPAFGISSEIQQR